MIFLAEVYEVIPDPLRPGVKVVFEDLVRAGENAYEFVRVLQSRMSPKGGASLWLPEVGELGAVGLTGGGYYIWLGSLPYLNENQVDSTPGIYYLKHQSGTTIQIRPNGDTEVCHPSGGRITLGQAAGALEKLQNTSKPVTTGNTSAPYLQISHPSGALIQIDQSGNGVLSGFASLKFQNGANRFVMDPLISAYNSHTHGSSGAGIPIVQLVENNICSPAKFQGPQGA